jgi:hypothetical protein
MVKEPFSDAMKEAIEACEDGKKTLVRLPWFRGRWTTRDAVLVYGCPSWFVTDTTVHALLKRGMLVTTHTRGPNRRPAAVRLATYDEMVSKFPADMQPMIRQAKSFIEGFLAKLNALPPEERRRLHRLNFPEQYKDEQCLSSTISPA